MYVCVTYVFVVGCTQRGWTLNMNLFISNSCTECASCSRCVWWWGIFPSLYQQFTLRDLLALSSSLSGSERRSRKNPSTSNNNKQHTICPIDMVSAASVLSFICILNVQCVLAIFVYSGIFSFIIFIIFYRGHNCL